RRGRRGTQRPRRGGMSSAELLRPSASSAVRSFGGWWGSYDLPGSPRFVRGAARPVAPLDQEQRGRREGHSGGDHHRAVPRVPRVDARSEPRRGERIPGGGGTLTWTKPRLLVPSRDPEEDEEADAGADLVRRLPKYQRLREAAASLGERPGLRRDVSTREASAEGVPADPDEPLPVRVTLWEL